jgi:AcrR family transcriptional regulator
VADPGSDSQEYDHFVAKARTSNRKPRETRTRIAQTALELFTRQGYVETTIDEIAAAAGVGRRTVFRHFATKEAILFDQLAVRREVAIQRLRDRPPSEPPLVSLHAVLRELCEQGYDRELLAQIRTVLASEPQFASEQLWGGTRAFEQKVIATLEHRLGKRQSLEIKALTHMALGWFATAAHMYLTQQRRRSLVRCFDDVVAVCVRSGTRDLS